MNLNTVRIFVRDLPQAEAFYKEQLSLPLQAGGSPMGFCVFGAGACTLVVEPVAADAPPEDQDLVGRFSGLSFTVADIAATYDALRARGVEFTEPPERQTWGGTLATLRDPAGNRLQLVQLPSP
jgi:catechol 2,3-dioxygenase-like lactoylglutathione lyase family enzyme